MTKISNQYSLTNILTADLANSRLGINNVSPTVALDVTGAGKFSGVTTVKSCSIVSTNGYSGQIIQQGDIFGTSATNLLIQSSTSNGIGFLTNGGTTFNMFINSTGNVGIGTSSPSAKLEVQQSADNYGYGYSLKNIAGNTWQLVNGGDNNLYIGYNTSTKFLISNNGNVGIGTSTPNISGQGANQRVLTVQGQAGYWGGVEIGSTATAGGSLMGFLGFAGTNINTVLTAYIGSWLENTGADAAGDLRFHTKPASAGATEKMRISGSGNIGAPTGSNIYNASDVRLKKNISPTTYGLDTISALNPVKFNWIEGFEPSEDGKDMLGFVAQEVQQVIPEAIESFGGNSITIGDTTIDNPLRVNEKFIIPVLVKAIQELSAENTSLINRIEALENK